MPPVRSWLVLVAGLLWLELWVATAVAVAHHLAYGFGGHGHPADVWGDFLARGGTALSPPLLIVVLFTGLIVLATRPGRWGWVGVGGLLAFALLALITILGEPFARHVLRPAAWRWPETGLVALSLAGSLLLLGLALGTLGTARGPWRRG